ncbi:hypothetical protein MTMBA_10870 [Moorella thermoacetica]
MDMIPVRLLLDYLNTEFFRYAQVDLLEKNRKFPASIPYACILHKPHSGTEGYRRRDILCPGYISWLYFTIRTEIWRDYLPALHPRPYGRGLPGRES